VHASKWLISRVVYKTSKRDTAMFLMNIRVLSQVLWCVCKTSNSVSPDFYDFRRR